MIHCPNGDLSRVLLSGVPTSWRNTALSRPITNIMSVYALSLFGDICRQRQRSGCLGRQLQVARCVDFVHW